MTRNNSGANAHASSQPTAIPHPQIVTRALVDGTPSQISAFLPLTFTFWSRSHKNVAHYALHLITYAPAKFEVATFTGVGGDAFTRNALYDLGVKVTQYVAQYPLHHMA